MCIYLQDNTFVKFCFKNKVNYIDITASHEVMKMMYNLNERAVQNNVYLFLSVGLAPGLTNLLVKKVKSYFDQIYRIDINIMLGSGEEHGKAAIIWTLANLNHKFEVLENGSSLEVKSFGEWKYCVFPNDIGKRKVYRFPMSDQMTLPVTQNIDSISTWLCLDSKIMTKILSLIKPLTKSRRIRNLLVSFMSISNIGSETYC